MTPEQGKVFYKFFADIMKTETETTRKVIRAIPEDGKSYKPDPKAKTADELAWHIATPGVWFRDFILSGKADMTEPPPAPTTIDATLQWYETNYGGRIQ